MDGAVEVADGGSRTARGTRPGTRCCSRRPPGRCCCSTRSGRRPASLVGHGEDVHRRRRHLERAAAAAGAPARSDQEQAGDPPRRKRWLSASSTEGTPTGWRAHFERAGTRGARGSSSARSTRGRRRSRRSRAASYSIRDDRLQAIVRTRNGVLAAPGRGRRPHVGPARAQRTAQPQLGHRRDHSSRRPSPARLQQLGAARRLAKGAASPLNVALSSDGERWRGGLTESDRAGRVRLSGGDPGLRRPGARHLHVEPPADQARGDRPAPAAVAGLDPGLTRERRIWQNSVGLEADFRRASGYRPLESGPFPGLDLKARPGIGIA